MADVVMGMKKHTVLQGDAAQIFTENTAKFCPDSLGRTQLI